MLVATYFLRFLFGLGLVFSLDDTRLSTSALRWYNSKNGSRMSKKHKVLTEVFDICRKRKNFIFHNALVKSISQKHGFGNPFDATKLDDTSKFPKVMLDNDYFLLHLGKGNHQFIKGIKTGFHVFEDIRKDDVLDWEYQKSILNEFDTSESNILSVASNQKIIHHFLYGDVQATSNVYFPRRTKASFVYNIGQVTIVADGLQMEIDLTMERNGFITVFEGKNKFPIDFAVYQIYHPFLYYHNLRINNQLHVKEINCCYILRKRVDSASVIRIYDYMFTNPLDMQSITFIKSTQYNLVHV